MASLLAEFGLGPWQWAALGLAAAGSGLGKTGVPGVNVLSVALFAVALPARASTGLVLPLLICADSVAVTLFRQNADWPQLRRLFPWAAVGVVAGWAAMGHLTSDSAFSRLMGAVLLLLVAIQIGRRYQTRTPAKPPSDQTPPPSAGSGLASKSVGCLAGFTTMVSNAAGPLMIVFLLGRGLPRTTLMGTAAWFFLCLNLFKLPFSVQMGLVTPRTLLLDLSLAPCAVGGALLGRWILPRLKQSHFEGIVLFFAAAAAIRLLLF